MYIKIIEYSGNTYSYIYEVFRTNMLRRIFVMVRFNVTVFALALFMGISVRTVMLLSVIDPVSGFIKSEYIFYAVLMIAFLIFAAGFIFIVSYFTPLQAKKDFVPRSLPFSVSLLVMAGAVFYESFVAKIGGTANVAQHILHSVFSALAVFSLIYIGVLKLMKKEYHPIFALAPAIFFIMRMVVIFSDFSTISTISDTIIETISGCLIIIVALYFAKLEGNAANKNRSRLFFALTLTAAYICAIGSVPRIICETAAQTKSIRLHLIIIPSYSGIAFALFCAALAYDMLFSLKKA